MGCDGGTIPTRDELVKTKKKPEQKDKEAALAALWNNCTISQQQLVKPIVSCQLGFLYNKESVLEYLLDKEKFEAANKFSHIKSLKHIKELQLTANPGYTVSTGKDKNGYVDRRMSPYSCPVVGFEMNGKYKFCFIWTCGCVISDRALKEVKSDTCHKCTKPFQPEDVIMLNADEEDMKTNVKRMEERRKSVKKTKRTVKEAGTEACDAGVGKKPRLANGSSADQQPCCSKSLPGPSHGLDKPKASKVVVNGSARRTGDRGPSGSSVTNDKTKWKGIQNDPTASKVLKSLFTTSEKGKQQANGHWVTYNPQYF